MIKGILASNASKLVASCVCPVAGTIALTVGVPEVKNAVHRATAPRAYALPKTRTRQGPAVGETDTPPVQTAMNVPPCEPVLTAGPIDNPFAPASLGEVNRDLTDPRNFEEAGRDIIDPGLSGDNNLILPSTGVPEPGAWLNLIVGFGLIGAATRYSLRSRPGEQGSDPA